MKYLILLVALSSCSKFDELNSEAAKNLKAKEIEDVVYITYHSIYTRDSRTGLCFYCHRVYGGIAFTNVPCTKEVLELVY